jgi:gluconokinase
MIIVVFGASASGKSTLGKALARSLAWPFVEGDDFHPEANRTLMRSGIPLGDADRQPWLEALARSIAGHLRSGASAVYACSALKRAYRVALVPAQTPAQAMRFVYLAAPKEVLSERLARRRGHFFPGSLLESQLHDLEPPADDEPAPTIEVDATRPTGEQVADVLARLSPAAS